MMKKIIYILLITLFLYSCNNQEDTTITVTESETESVTVTTTDQSQGWEWTDIIIHNDWNSLKIENVNDDKAEVPMENNINYTPETNTLNIEWKFKATATWIIPKEEE